MAKATAKKTRRTRGELAALVAQVDAYRAQHPELDAVKAVAGAGVKGLSSKNYNQFKQRHKENLKFPAAAPVETRGRPAGVPEVTPRGRRSRTLPADVTKLVEKIDALIEANEGLTAAEAHRRIGSTIPLKNYYQWKRRFPSQSMDFPLDAIPKRKTAAKANGSGESPYAISKRRRTGELDTAFRLINMGMEILKRSLG